MNRIGERIKRRRVERELSVPKLADAIGKTPRYVEMIEAGGRTPSVDTLYRLAEALDVSPAAFLVDTDEASGKPLAHAG